MATIAKIGRRERPTRGWLFRLLENLRSQLTWLDLLVGAGGIITISLLMVGFRYQDLSEELRLRSAGEVVPGVDLFGGHEAGVIDQFHTHNAFFGGQLGARAEYYWHHLVVNLRTDLLRNRPAISCYARRGSDAGVGAVPAPEPDWDAAGMRFYLARTIVG